MRELVWRLVLSGRKPEAHLMFQLLPREEQLQYLSEHVAWVTSGVNPLSRPRAA